MISPVLHTVSIGTVGIGQAKLQYSFAVKDKIEMYKLANFDFQANDFRIDSVSEAQRGFWYSRGFSFEATGIEGLMTARNHRFTVKRMTLDTESGDFNLERIRLYPCRFADRMIIWQEALIRLESAVCYTTRDQCAVAENRPPESALCAVFFLQ